MNKRIILCLLLPLLLAPLIGVSVPSTVQMPNGFTLILAPDEGIEATCVLTYHIQGTRDDPPDLQGASFFFQYLMPLATENLEPYDRLMFIKRVGGVSSGRVNVDNSIFYQIVPDDRLAHALWMESERLSSLKILDRDINLQKANIYRQISHLRKTNVAYRAKAWVRTRVFENTVYRNPLFGDLDRIRGLNNHRIKQVYEGFTNPANIIMVVAGNFNPAQVLDSVNKFFSRPAGSNGVNSRNYTVAAPRNEFINKNWLIDNLNQNFFICGIRAPSKMTQDHLYFEFLRYYLLDGRISKLKKLMTNLNNLDVTVSGELSDNIESNALLIQISSHERLDLENAKYILDKEFEALKTIPLPNATMKSIRALMEIDYLKNMSTLERRSKNLAENFHLFGKINLERNHVNRIRKISQYDIMGISKKYLSKGNQVILNVYKK